MRTIEGYSSLFVCLFVCYQSSGSFSCLYDKLSYSVGSCTKASRPVQYNFSSTVYHYVYISFFLRHTAQPSVLHFSALVSVGNLIVLSCQ